MKNIKNIVYSLTVLVTCLVINAYGEQSCERTFTTYDYNIQNKTNDKILTVSFNLKNPNWSGNKNIELTRVDKEGNRIPSTCELEGTCKTMNSRIDVKPGETFQMKDVPTGLPGYYRMSVKAKDGSSQDVGGGPLDKKFQRTINFQSDRMTIDIWYDASTNKGNFGVIIETLNK